MKEIISDKILLYNPETGEHESITAMRGESAYEAAVRLGYTTLTEEQWLKEYDTKRNAAITAIEAKGEETLESIPDDYSELAEQVATLTEEIEEITSDSPNLLPVAAQSSNVMGADVLYADGTVTIDGTASAHGGRLVPVIGPFELDAGAYAFSMDASYGSRQFFVESGSSILAQIGGSINAASFTLDDKTSVYVGTNVSEGETLTNAIYKLQIEKGDTASKFVSPSWITAVDKEARDSLADYTPPVTPVNLVWASGKALSGSGVWANNSGWSYADYVLTQGQALIVTLNRSTAAYSISVWDDKGESLVKIPFYLAEANQRETLMYICQKQKERVRIHSMNSDTGTVVATLYNVGDMLNQSNVAAASNSNQFCDLLHGNTICIGDSLTQGSYTGGDLHPDQSYPAFLEKLTGNQCVNAGRAGWTTLDWWTGSEAESRGFPYYQYADYDTAIIFLGTNGGLTDTLDADVNQYSSYADYAATNTGAYCKIIEGMKAQNPDINIFVCHVWASGASVSVTNDVISKIAVKYGLTVINLNVSEFWSPYTIYHAVPNNIHLGKIGYAKMAEIVRQAMNDDVYSRPEVYNKIPD